jgi:GTP-binding protein HflX
VSAILLDTTVLRERAILVGISTPDNRGNRVEEYLDELALLADSAGADVVHRITQGRQRIDSAHLIGKGKAEEIAWLVQEKNIQLVLFDDDLTPVQVRNLEKVIKCKIVDRSGLILDIFASRARTREAKTQVELAQLQYLLPRLTRQWTHLSKQFGGIGTKGPGETQIESDRRVIRARITHLRGKLREIARERELQRKGREQLPHAALVGYTNAGKSTLLNWFSQADVQVEDRLFATLDSTVRLVHLSPLHKILLSDTVGFIRKLPHHLVASFQSTLEEVRAATILLHVVDVSHPLFEEQISVVNETLEEIGAQGKPTIMVFNKIDRVDPKIVVAPLRQKYDHAVFLAASRGINMHSLERAVMDFLDADMIEEEVTLRQADHDLVSRIHDIAQVIEKRYEPDCIYIRFRINRLEGEKLRHILTRRSGV